MWEKRENVNVFFIFFHATARGAKNTRYVFSRCQLSTRYKKSAHATIDLRSQHKLKPRPTRLVLSKANEYIDDGLADLGYPRLRELAGGALRSSPKPEKLPIFAIREGSRKFVFCLLHTSGLIFFHQTPGQLPQHITVQCVNTVTLGWVGAADERAPFRLYDAVVCFVDRCLSRTRNLPSSK